MDIYVLQIIILIIVTGIVGYIGGLVGMPLGPVRLFFFLIFGIPPLVAIGTNLAISFIAVISVIWPHVKNSNIDYKVAFLFGGFSLLGSFLGGLMSENAPMEILIWLITFFLFISALLILQSVHFKKKKIETTQSIKFFNKNIFKYSFSNFLGMLIGLFGGATGLVLGALRYPILINYLKISARKTSGTNSMINLFVAVFGLSGHGVISGISGNSHFDFKIFMPLAVVVSLTSFWGAKSIGKFSEIFLLKLLYVTLLLMTLVMILRQFF